MIDAYDWAGGREAMLRFGPDTGPVVVAALPLFEEANRTRAFLVTLLRRLADRGIGSILPDLPGQSESLVPLETVALAEMRAAYAAAAELVVDSRPRFGVAIRSGALLDGDAGLAGRWHFSPQTGAELLRELNRIRAAGGLNADHATIAGNRISRRLLEALPDAVPVPARTVRLITDQRAADRTIEAAPLWRRSEPDNDLTLAQTLADDILEWVAACGR